MPLLHPVGGRRFGRHGAAARFDEHISESPKDYYDAVEHVFKYATEQFPLVPPLPVFYAKAIIPLSDKLLHTAAITGSLDVYSHLQQRYGLKAEDNFLVGLAKSKVTEGDGRQLAFASRIG
ncbi:hypothetical protein V8E36_004943 [Tilletia maclaganii]